MELKMNKRNLLIDMVLLASMLLVMEPSLSGEAIHEWLGMGMLAVVVVHLVIHWNWIINVGGQFFKKLWHSSRLKFVVDSLLFVAFITVSLSGILISRTALPALGINLGQVGMAWRRLHSLAADTSILLVGLHFALNWGWVVNTFKKYVFSPIGRLFRSSQAQQATVPVTLDGKH
jgi:hypothetical protein